MPKRRLILEWLAVLVVSLIGCGLFTLSSLGEKADNLLFDNAISWRSTDPNDAIIIVEIDTASTAELGRWVWPRTIHSGLISRISAAQPKAIGYDVLFAEPSRAEDDALLARAVAKAGNLVLPSYYDEGKNGRLLEPVMPIPQLLSAARSVGYVNVTFDSDGLVRRSKITPMTSAGRAPQMMEALATVATGRPSAFTSRHRGEAAADLLIPYHAGGAFRRVSAAQVFRGEVPPEFFRDKIVLVGATAAGLGDTLPVPGPAGGAMSGIELQANLLTALMRDESVTAVSAVARFLCSAATLLILLLMFWRLRPVNSLYLAVGTGVVGLALSAFTLAISNLWFAPGGLICGIILAYPLWSWRRLAALNNFVESETKNLSTQHSLSAGEANALQGLDSVAASAASLKLVIGELQGLKSFMAAIIEDAPDALSVVDESGQIQLANAAAKSALGASCEGQYVADLISKVATGSAKDGHEIELHDGRVMLLKSVPLQIASGGVKGTILRMADITDMRLIEQEREDMLAFLSHDMRGPQAAIISLLDQKGSLSPAEQVQRIRTQAEASLKLADNFVQLARLSKVQPAFETVDLVALLEEAIDQTYPAAQAKQLIITRPNKPEEALVEGDGWMILRAFNNILNNAVRYSPPGGSIACAVTCVAESREYTVEISDQGPGMSKKRLESLFKMVGQIDPSARLSSGLGLAYVKKVMDMHGGKVDCHSDGKGTSFTLHFKASSTC